MQSPSTRPLPRLTLTVLSILLLPGGCNKEDTSRDSPVAERDETEAPAAHGEGDAAPPTSPAENPSSGDDESALTLEPRAIGPITARTQARIRALSELLPEHRVERGKASYEGSLYTVLDVYQGDELLMRIEPADRGKRIETASIVSDSIKTPQGLGVGTAFEAIEASAGPLECHQGEENYAESLLCTGPAETITWVFPVGTALLGGATRPAKAWAKKLKGKKAREIWWRAGLIDPTAATRTFEVAVAGLRRVAGEIEVYNLGLSQRPDMSEKVTIIPRCGSDKRSTHPVACTEPGPLVVPIAAEKKNPLSEDLAREYPGREFWWDVTLEKITRSDYLAYKPTSSEGKLRDEYRGSVAVVYPAQPNVRALDPAALPEAALPRSASARTVKFALDLDGDDHPDWVQRSFCCKTPTEPPSACDYTCTETFSRSHDGWKLIDSSKPL